MIARAPHTQLGVPHPTFASDNQKVDDILTYIVKDTNAWVWRKGRAHVCNSRRIFTNFKTHYPGASNTNNIVDGTELMLRSTFYTGEKRNFTFEKYVQMHKDAHTMMENLTATQYPGIDSRSKVKHLFDGIKTSSLDTAKATM